MTSLAFLVDQLFSPTPGGMGTYVRELVPALSRADPSLELTLFHSRFDADSPEDLLALYPTVLMFARLLPMTLRYVALALRPDRPAENEPRAMKASFSETYLDVVSLWTRAFKSSMPKASILA